MDVLKINPGNFEKSLIKIIENLEKGRVIVCPTDTVYGLIADATNKKTVDKLFKIKKRLKNKALPVFIKDIKTAKKIAWINKEQEEFLKKNWPGKTTIVLKRKKNKKIYGVDKKTIALRIPDYQLINLIFEKTNFILTGTSANLSNQPASTKIKQVVNQFKDKNFQPDLIIDFNNLKLSRPSKVIDLTGSKLKVLRK
jgi:L-threonylcarbamoyladenylate synthase